MQYKPSTLKLLTFIGILANMLVIKFSNAEWGDSVVLELAKYIKQNEPDLKGFSDKNIWRMKQFYETYKNFPKLSTLLREISWLF
jgi:hypothetical protein